MRAGISPVQAVKAGNVEARYKMARVELLNQEAKARAGTNGRETARYRQRRQPDGCAGKSLNDVGKGVASQQAKGRKAKRRHRVSAYADMSGPYEAKPPSST